MCTFRVERLGVCTRSETLNLSIPDLRCGLKGPIERDQQSQRT